MYHITFPYGPCGGPLKQGRYIRIWSWCGFVWRCRICPVLLDGGPTREGQRVAEDAATRKERRQGRKRHGRKKHLKFIPLEEEKYGEEFVYSFFYDTVLEFMF